MSDDNATSAPLSARPATARALYTMSRAVLLTGDTDLASLLSTVSIAISADIVEIANESTQWLAAAAVKKIGADVAATAAAAKESMLREWDDDGDTTHDGKSN